MNAGDAPMTAPLVTVLIDTYNHGYLLEKSIESVITQDFPADQFEILVIDDGSTDDTAERVRKYGSRVRYLRKANGGQASAFNAAIPEVRGEIVALLDGDDWWESGKLSAVVNAFEQNPEVSAVGHGYHHFYEATKEMKLCVPPERTVLSLATPEAARGAMREWAFLQTSALTVRKKVLERVVPIPEALVFSADFPIAAAAVAMNVLILAQPLGYYRVHAGNLYAGDSADIARTRRKCEMDELMHSLTWPMLLQLGAPADSVSALLGAGWIEASRRRLHLYGGSRLRTFRTEMRAFHLAVANPSIGYRLFKYLGVGAATLLLSPQQFYGALSWYSKRDLKRFRERVFQKEAAPRDEPR